MTNATRFMTSLAAGLLLVPGWATADTGAHAGHEHAAHDPHLRLTEPRAPTAQDEARYAALLATIRTDLAHYRDVEQARADGYEQFLPGLRQAEYHFTRNWNGFKAAFGFNPAAPTSLLYRREPDGSYTLTGVMYTAPHGASEAELDARVPLSMARWHEHVNLCVPGPAHRERWRETRDGAPLFGPKSPIATEADCTAVGGTFLPRLFGWMVHVQVFAGGDGPPMDPPLAAPADQAGLDSPAASSM